MTRRAYFLLGLLVALAAGAWAQSGGYPSRIRAQTVTASIPSVPATPVYNYLAASSRPIIAFDETDQAANNRDWLIQAFTEDFFISAYADDGMSAGHALTISRTGTTIDAIALASTAVTVNAVDLTPASGTFVATFDDAGTTSPTLTFDYQRVGNLVVMRSVGSSGFPITSDSTNFTATAAVPASLRPASGQSGALFGGFQNNSADTDGCVAVQSTGNLQFFRQATAGAACTSSWTNSGSKTAPNTLEFSYMLGNP